MEINYEGRLYRVTGYPDVVTDKRPMVEVFVAETAALRQGRWINRPAHWRQLRAWGETKNAVATQAREQAQKVTSTA